MRLLSAIKTLGVAIALRILETCRLLCTTFWALSLVLCISYIALETLPQQPSDFIILLTALLFFTFILLLCLLSRSSMTLKNYQHIASLRIARTYFTALIMLVLTGATYMRQTYRTGPFPNFAFPSLWELFVLPPLIVLLFILWMYVLLDSNSTLPLPKYVLKSLSQTYQLIKSSIMLFLLFATILYTPALLLFYIFAIYEMLWAPVTATLLIILVPATAVLYEEMRYRTTA